MINNRALYFLLLLLVGLVGCSGKRDSKQLLVIRDSNTPQSAIDLLTNIEHMDATDVATDLNVLLSDSASQYSLIALLVNDQFAALPEHQHAVERYVQSGGGFIVSPMEVNRYQWPWLYELLSKDETHGFFDGGRYAIMDDDVGNLIEFLVGANEYKPELATGPTAPDPERFITRVLNQDLYEPMELEILPDNRVLIMERRGRLKLFDPTTGNTSLIAEMDVCIEGNYEDGLLGMALDPDFKNNNYLYIYYSPQCDNSNQLLSRFRLLGGDSLLLASEKVVLEVGVQRETCCHSGGEVMFDGDGYLWLSTGDNTSSKESDGYSPLDERPGRGPFDAQKSSGNTHDLRGKILRIKVNEDGTYSIPDGNLFAKDGSEGRPEIYVMGARNPFRFTVDDRTGYLYWGDVGPDAGRDSRYGSQSFDEWNQARTPGNYGWPYFMGNNVAFPDRDFETDEVGEYFDPENPVNDSPNNYGSKFLPPARPSMIWYPYGPSAEFPMLGRGSRTAMAGPFYRKPNAYSQVAFPEYYNNKLFIFEWARSWIKVITFDENDDLYKIEPFLPDFEFSKPIDVEFGRDGAMYVLDYGANYFANNEDARLLKIEYWEENIPPVAVINVNNTVGGVPLNVELNASDSYDLDADAELSFEWFADDEDMPFFSGPVAEYTFEEAGYHTISLRAIDSNGSEGTASVDITAGNEPPKVAIEIEGNRSFYFDDNELNYQVTVTDNEDGTTSDGSIDGAAVNVQFNFLASGYDLANLGPELFAGADASMIAGKTLIDGSDCKSCHSMDQVSIGPSYLRIADRYKTQYDAAIFLAEKIRNGGNGNWGEAMMAGHPQHSVEETTLMAEYILSLADEKQSSRELSGRLALDKHDPSATEGAYLFTVSYTDTPQHGVRANTANELLALRNPRLEAEDYDFFNKVSRINSPQMGLSALTNFSDGAYFGYQEIDLSSVRSIKARILPFSDGTVSIRTGKPNGEEIGSLNVTAAGENQAPSVITIDITRVDATADVYFIMQEGNGMVDWVEFSR